MQKSFVSIEPSSPLWKLLETQCKLKNHPHCLRTRRTTTKENTSRHSYPSLRFSHWQKFLDYVNLTSNRPSLATLLNFWSTHLWSHFTYECGLHWWYRYLTPCHWYSTNEWYIRSEWLKPCPTNPQPQFSLSQNKINSRVITIYYMFKFR